MFRAFLLVLPAVAWLGVGPATAQTHSQHPMSQDAKLPTMPGQDIFGAIAEIALILRNDPQTDWSTVDLEALRLHLLDMEAVATGPTTGSEAVEGGIAITLLRTEGSGDAASRMVQAHSPVLEAETGWSSAVEITEDRTVWRVTSPRPEAAQEIRALSFIGLLATGAHHQEHHLAMARGMTAH